MPRHHTSPKRDGQQRIAREIRELGRGPEPRWRRGQPWPKGGIRLDQPPLEACGHGAGADGFDQAIPVANSRRPDTRVPAALVLLEGLPRRPGRRRQSSPPTRTSLRDEDPGRHRGGEEGRRGIPDGEPLEDIHGRQRAPAGRARHFSSAHEASQRRNRFVGWSHANTDRDGSGILVIGSGSCAAMQTEVDFPAIDEALRLGRQCNRGRAHALSPGLSARTSAKRAGRLHRARHTVPSHRPGCAGARRAIGETAVTGKAGSRHVGCRGHQLDVYVELTFHPLNTYIGVPRVHGADDIGDGSTRWPTSIDRLSRWTPRLEGLPPAVPTPGGIPGAPRSQPLLGGTLIAGFH